MRLKTIKTQALCFEWPYFMLGFIEDGYPNFRRSAQQKIITLSWFLFYDNSIT